MVYKTIHDRSTRYWTKKHQLLECTRNSTTVLGGSSQDGRKWLIILVSKSPKDWVTYYLDPPSSIKNSKLVFCSIKFHHLLLSRKLKKLRPAPQQVSLSVGFFLRHQYREIRGIFNFNKNQTSSAPIYLLDVFGLSQGMNLEACWHRSIGGASPKTNGISRKPSQHTPCSFSSFIAKDRFQICRRCSVLGKKKRLPVFACELEACHLQFVPFQSSAIQALAKDTDLKNWNHSTRIIIFPTQTMDLLRGNPSKLPATFIASSLIPPKKWVGG